jgi:large subunit ribosomal protein L15
MADKRVEAPRLKAPKGGAKKKRIRGRGYATGKGIRCGRGDKGQNSRSGGGVRLGFEGGQMPLYRRIARRGFSNSRFKKEYNIVNVGQLEKKFEDGDVVNNKSLIEKGLIAKKGANVKILGNGEISKKLKIDVAKVTQSALSKITSSGGEWVGGDKAIEKPRDTLKGSQPEEDSSQDTQKKAKDENGG